MIIGKTNLLSLLGLGLLLTMTGCSAVATLSYIMFPNDVKADYEGLKNKNTIVICRAESLGYSDPTVGRDLAMLVGKMMEQNDKEIKVVSDQQVSDWIDRNPAKEFVDIGRGLKSDMVVGIELEGFDIRQGPTLLQGRAVYKVRVLDMKQNGKVVYEYRPDMTKFPVNGPIPSTERSESDFRRQFLAILAENIAHKFYDYDSRRLHALDGSAIK